MTTPTTTTERELVIERIFNAPRALVWKAWTDPEMLAKWWGPKNFTTTVKKMDARVGGSVLVGMHSPEGQTFWSTGTYLEIVPMEKLVVTDSFADENGNIVSASHYGMEEGFPLELTVIITLEDIGANKTKMTLRHIGMPESTMKEMTGAGWNEMFDKLQAILS